MLMKGGDKRSQGFTIIEVMIVLAITALLLLGAIVLVAGRQNETEFTVAMQEIQSEIQQEISLVTVGNYTDTNNVNCMASAIAGTPPVVFFGPGSRGANQDCVYLGTALHFYGGPGGTNPNINYYSVIPIVGRQCHSGSTATGDCTPIQSIGDAVPVAVEAGKIAPFTSVPNDMRNYPLENGITVEGMCYETSGNCNSVMGLLHQTCTVAFLNNPADTYDASSFNLLSGGLTLDLYAMEKNNCFNNSAGIDPPNDIQNIDDNLELGSGPPNPVTDVEICFSSATTNQSGLLTLSSGNNSTAAQYSANSISTTLSIKDDTTC